MSDRLRATTSTARTRAAAAGVEARFPWLAVALIAGAGVVLRLLAARGDLWLDEIWTLDLIAGIDSPVELLTRLKHDNNHPLNSLFCWLLLGTRHEILYRLPSVLAGGVAIVAAARVAWRLAEASVQGVAAITAAGAVACSFLLVNYGSEARGYGLAVALGLVAWMCVVEGSLARRALWMPLYWLATLAALLAHASSIHLVAALLIQNGCAVVLAGDRRRTAFVPFLQWHLVPVACCVAYYALFLRSIVVGGGNATELSPVIVQTGSALAGLPEAFGPVFHAAWLIVMTIWVLLREWRVSFGRLAFFATAIVLSPIVVHGFSGNPLLYPRYFVIPATVLLVGASAHVAALWTAPRARRLLAVVAVLFIAGNGYSIIELIRDGRGAYAAAVSWMAEHSSQSMVVVASDNDFRNGTVLNHYARHLGLAERVQVVRGEAAAVVRPEWIVIHQVHPEREVENSFQVAPGVTYVARGTYPGGRLSGWTWYVYHYATAPARPPPR